jgi:GH24 family phage-related lysozyme (muramidase)
MNRKIKIKYLYKVAANKPMTMREKILAGMLGLGTLAGVSQVLGKEEMGPPVAMPAPSVEMAPQSLQYIDYEIKPGDNIMNIALKLFPGQAANAKKHILEINGITEDAARNLKIGQIIKIPNSREDFVSHFSLEENHHLTASSFLREFIKKKEDLHPVPVDVEKNDNKDIKTVGYGHRLDTEAKKINYQKELRLLKQMGRKNGMLSENDPVVLQWLESDIKEAEDKVKAKSLPGLTQNQFDALVSFAFNTGGVPDIKEDLKAGNFAAAADKIRNHPSASIEGYSGLGERRAEEADLFLKGI